jgi:hypothetical protein
VFENGQVGSLHPIETRVLACDARGVLQGGAHVSQWRAGGGEVVLTGVSWSNDERLTEEFAAKEG